MTIITLKPIHRSSLAALTITERTRTINALKMIQTMTVPHGSPAEARTLAEIADYWVNKDGDVQISLKSR